MSKNNLNMVKASGPKKDIIEQQTMAILDRLDEINGSETREGFDITVNVIINALTFFLLKTIDPDKICEVLQGIMLTILANIEKNLQKANEDA